MSGARILVVDDEPQIRRFLRLGLEGHGYAVHEATTAEAALRAAAAAPPELVVLDLGLPDREGFAVLERLREWSRAPVIVLSVRSREAEKVRALELGADDYVVKPFGMPELLARIRAALRRAADTAEPVPEFRVGGLEVDLVRRLVRVEGAEVRLSPKQYRLLQTLVAHAGKVVTHRQLLGAIWGAAHADDVQYLRVFVKKLRARIEADPARPAYLLTELGVGYRLRTPDQL
ncbi:MAG TPA: response regulator [Burkholderiales bacterium]|jgi:two-component system KDP operon response regulator KdpE|nr:response regulator [Burkholderiales bacterium]